MYGARLHADHVELVGDAQPVGADVVHVRVAGDDVEPRGLRRHSGEGDSERVVRGRRRPLPMHEVVVPRHRLEVGERLGERRLVGAHVLVVDALHVPR